MKKSLFLLLSFTILLSACTMTVKAPVAKKISHTTTICGHEISDDYYWMRLSDEQKNAVKPDRQTSDVLSYLKQENLYSSSYLKPYKELKETLFNEMKGRLKEDDSSVPYFENGYWYYNRYEAGKEYPVFLRKKGKMEGEEEILLDVNKVSEGKPFCAIYNLKVSPDNSQLAYSADFVGRNQFTIYVKDLSTGALSADSISNVASEIEWSGDSKAIYYLGKDKLTLRTDKVNRRVLGSGNDEVLLSENDERFSFRLDKTSDNKYILATASQTLTDEMFYLDAFDNLASFHSFYPRTEGLKYNLDHSGNTFYIRTNRDNAVNYKIEYCDDANVASGKWKTMVPEAKESFITSFVLLKDYLVLNEIKEANSSLKAINLSTRKEQSISFNEPCYVAGIGTNRDITSNILRYTYTSLSSPSCIYDYNLTTRESVLLKETEVPAYNKENYVVERVWVTARDGAKVPMSLIYKKGFEKNGLGKAFLYAYGSYGSSSLPNFRSNIFSLLDRGFVYAIAHIRGGSELGRQWYEDGKLLKKMNTFNDFNDCAKYLISEQYTTSEGLFASGASAGGLLIGAVINLEPELYKGVIAGVPFVDVLNTMADETIPLTTFEWDEWGDPRKEPYFSYMAAYSPYDNVQAKNYPNILVTTSYWDSQVQYWEPAKWVAKLRATKTDQNVLIMCCDMDSGHGGASGRYKQLEKTAESYSFILSL